MKLDLSYFSYLHFALARFPYVAPFSPLLHVHFLVESRIKANMI